MHMRKCARQSIFFAASLTRDACRVGAALQKQLDARAIIARNRHVQCGARHMVAFVQIRPSFHHHLQTDEIAALGRHNKRRVAL